jgi:hypothetical protein
MVIGEKLWIEPLVGAELALNSSLLTQAYSIRIWRRISENIIILQINPVAFTYPFVHTFSDLIFPRFSRHTVRPRYLNSLPVKSGEYQFFKVGQRLESNTETK